MAERVGFEFTRKRSFNNIERTAGNEKQWKAVVSSANGSQTDHGSGRKAPRKGPKIDVLPRHLSRKSEPYGLRRSQSSNLRLATIRELMATKAFTGTDRGLLRSVLGPWSPVPKCEAPGAPISVEEHSSMAPRPHRQSQNPPLQESSAIPALPWPSKPPLRYSPGLIPTTRLNPY